MTAPTVEDARLRRPVWVPHHGNATLVAVKDNGSAVVRFATGRALRVEASALTLLDGGRGAALPAEARRLSAAVVRVLGILAAAPEPIGTRGVAEASGLPIRKAYRVLGRLRHLGLVELLPPTAARPYPIYRPLYAPVPVP